MKSSSAWIIGGFVFGLLETAMIWWRIQTAPFFWICLLWTAGTILLFVRLSSRPLRAVAINLAAVLGAVALCEGLLWLGQQRNPYSIQPGTVLGGSFARHGYFIEMPAPGIGYRPRPGMAATSIRTVNGRVAYSVTYKVDADGLRIGPPAGSETAAACILMFGDSMAWGEGLNDGQTTAYQLALLGGGRLRVRNFAFTGYSAHQMLWMIRSGEVAAKARCDPRLPVLAIYQTLPNNVSRVAGLRGWDDYGPRFRLIEGKTLVYAGGFDAGESILHDHIYVPGPIATALSRSVVFSRTLGRDRPPDGYDLLRFESVVASAAQGLRHIYPRLDFLTIVWPDLNDEPDMRAAKVAALIGGLRQRHIRAVAIDDLVPGFDAAPLPYLIAGDGHPNALMHHRLALALRRREGIFEAASRPAISAPAPEIVASRNAGAAAPISGRSL